MKGASAAAPKVATIANERERGRIEVRSGSEMSEAAADEAAGGGAHQEERRERTSGVARADRDPPYDQLRDEDNGERSDREAVVEHITDHVVTRAEHPGDGDTHYRERRPRR